MLVTSSPCAVAVVGCTAPATRTGKASTSPARSVSSGFNALKPASCVSLIPMRAASAATVSPRLATTT